MGKSVIPDQMLVGEFLFRRFGATVADYDCAADEDTRLELIDGVLVMHSPANVRHEDIFRFLLILLDGYSSARGLGRVFGSRTPIVFNEERRFEPDLLFIASEHISRLGEVALAGPPDLAVEILSPATRDYDLNEKRDAYAEGGVPEYWMIDPMSSTLVVDRPAGTRFVELTQGLYHSAALPGFWLEAGWLWREPLPDVHACLREILGA